MSKVRPAARGSLIGRAVVVALVLMPVPALAAGAFPYDRQLMLDVAPMGKVRRVPSVTISEDGTARLGLWCRTVGAAVAVSGGAVRIVPAPLPEALPQYMSDGQCSPERMAADADLLAALEQVTAWRATADGVVTLEGAQMLRFRPPDH